MLTVDGKRPGAPVPSGARSVPVVATCDFDCTEGRFAEGERLYLSPSRAIALCRVGVVRLWEQAETKPAGPAETKPAAPPEVKQPRRFGRK